MLRSKWDLLFLRAGFIVLSLSSAILFRPFGWPVLPAVLFSLVISILCVFLELNLRKCGLRALIGGVGGLFLGLSLACLLLYLFVPVSVTDSGRFFRFLLPVATGYLGLTVGISRAGDLYSQGIPGWGQAKISAGRLPLSPRFVDTSALIDGRIADIADAGFLDGRWTVPQFVLNELQSIADSADAAKRNRGRRGLDVVARLQNRPGVRVDVSPVDFSDIREVDRKLIEAAKSSGGQIMTTDFNLSKLAQVQGIRVLNVNELANALRPVVLQGETMKLLIAKEGKEPTQGLAYLDDGTMVVVEGARRHIGKTVNITVTSVIQSAAGKMIFGKV